MCWGWDWVGFLPLEEMPQGYDLSSVSRPKQTSNSSTSLSHHSMPHIFFWRGRGLARIWYALILYSRRSLILQFLFQSQGSYYSYSNLHLSPLRNLYVWVCGTNKCTQKVAVKLKLHGGRFPRLVQKGKSLPRLGKGCLWWTYCSLNLKASTSFQCQRLEEFTPRP